MSEYSELIKNFEKIREYMRDFYVYGFKARKDFTYKSARTYDNERRRVESWLNSYVQWDYTGQGKQVCISVDGTQVEENPLYQAWKSKTFTNNDVILHFAATQIIKQEPGISAEILVDRILERYGVLIDVQTVRNKLKEYDGLGLICAKREGRGLYYHLAEDSIRALPFWQKLLDSIRLFQGISPFGFLGSTILDQEGDGNHLFRFKHYFMVHTLEDGVLYQLLKAMREKRSVSFDYYSRKTGRTTGIRGIPMQVLVSVQGGRRYICLYQNFNRRYQCFRLDGIKNVRQTSVASDYERLRRELEPVRSRCWGVSFGETSRGEQLFVKLSIDEKNEQYLLQRIRREGRAGELVRLEKNLYLYSLSVWDSNEVLPWLKTFVGRIVSVEGTNRDVVNKLYRDIERMHEMYAAQGD